jgi:hypothetical protein
MIRELVVSGLVCAAIVSGVAAQAQKPAAGKSVMYDVTIKADTVYTGTMELTVDRGKVTGDMRLTSPSEITGKPAGSEKKGVLTLEFPYVMTERKCEGTVTMTITLSPKPGPASGTMEAGDCGGDPAKKLPGTVELVPSAAKKKPQ